MKAIEPKYLEAVLFVAAKPVPLDVLKEVFQVDEENILALIEALRRSLVERDAGIRIRCIEDTVELVNDVSCTAVVAKIRQREEVLGRAALETLAIVAFKQPLTKAEVEEIRGVNCERLLKQLLHKELIMEVGRKEGPGRPILYGTTETFLRSIGKESVSDLTELIHYDGSIIAEKQ